jgi:4-aminobutyrate aminotransferase-like enzyme
VEPPLTISYQQLDKFLDALEDSLTAVYRERAL